MRREGIDLAVVGPSSTLRYVLGYEAFALDRLTVLLCGCDSGSMVIPGFDADEFVDFTGFTNIFPWSDRDGHSEALRSAIETLKLPPDPVIAIDDELSFAFLRQLEGHLGNSPLTALNPLLMPLRMVKDQDEQEKMRAAGDVVSRGLDFALTIIRPGRTERDVARDTERALWDAGAESVELVLVATGAASVAPHHKASDAILERGEALAVCIVAGVGGYLADISQHAFLGRPPADYAHAYEAVSHAEQAAIRAARPGVTAEDVETAAFDVIKDAGLASWFGVRTGHGIGIDIVEPPSIWAGDRTPLQPGIATIIGPGVYVPEKFGIRIDDTVIVGEDGARPLTRASRPLTIID